MSAPEVRQVKRPRISLSCSVCRSRKVRCGREQPACTNCIRLNKTCVYKAVVLEKSANRAEQLYPGFREEYLIGDDLPSSLSQSQGNAVSQTKENHPNQSNPNRDGGNSISNNNNNNNRGASSHPHSREYHMLPDLAHSAVYPWEQSMQVLSNHEIAGSGVRPGSFPNQRLSTQNHQPSLLSRDYLSLRRGSRARFISKTFWGLVAGQERLSDDFFDENRHTPLELPPPHIAAVGLFKLLTSLPAKPVCDVLLQSFFIAVWPLVPFLETSRIQADYDDFWEFCRNSDNAIPPLKFQDDPTFICLLFAVLLCGASAAPISMWESVKLKTLRKDTIVDQLRSAYTTSLSMCAYTEHPTLNSLVSTLLTGPFIDDPLKLMHNIISISTTVRIAQTMGLHSELAYSALDPVAREMRRRVWWHIVWMDVQSSISAGLPLCCGSAMLGAVGMVAFTRDRDTGNISSSPVEPLRSGESIAMIYTTGRYETARLELEILNSLQSAQGLNHEGFRELVTATKQFHQKIDALMTRIPTQGIPEEGFISSRLANATMLTHPALYKDDTSQHTVFGTWTRITLTLFKLEVSVLLQKPFLKTPEYGSLPAQKLWTRHKKGKTLFQIQGVKV
ncbi:hypothetical protein TSTA_117850 [Talaromyces stipitatus ATCC 10500]|uniref:Zn(2)-C6 fungal-type domain-containing protein n=1 Tax=Talaromyces stipitatus (strain ATCC 10500 / CBS 375.48 / QM 6759 / NRRL 1006) TaxID=441959 RepID=B8M9L1_TALSN|nr:uncharacterized protein TSTA_117850 [Talaromyces stipitatus ATCC 10500]EED18013.1 hypothetical protein TSTA_117850 [Talaromyces stipitatus ATCC 10500]